MKPVSQLPVTTLPHIDRWIPLALAALLALPTVAQAQCPAGATGSGAQSMAIRLKEGEARRTINTSDQTTTQTVMGQDQSTHQVMKMGMRYDVLPQGADGRSRVRVTYESASLDATTPMSSFKWSSADTAAGPPPQGAQVFAALVGHGYTVAMDPDGSGRQVEGWDSLVTRFLDAVPAPPGSSTDEMKETLKKTVGESLIGGSLRGAVVLMPSKSAAVGDSWSCTTHTGGTLGITDNSTWTVTGRSNGVTTVNIVSEMASDSAASTSMGAMTVHYALKGTRKSTMEIEDATGWIVRDHSESQISGTATVEGSPMGPMEIPMTVKTTSTTEPVTGG